MVRVGTLEIATRFAVPSGRAGAVLAELDAAGLSLARARVAARLGDPDPFPLRRALAAAPEATVVGGPGLAIGRDRLDAVLLDAGEDPAQHGLFAGRPPGPLARSATPRPCLRFARPPLPALQLGELRRWSTAEIGDAPVATVRCLLPFPGGVALGSDYGLTLARGEQFRPFPWPEGARREARRVEAMAFHRGQLLVGTQQVLVAWDLRGPATVRRHARDGEDGWDDLRCMLSDGDRLLVGWRTHLEGGRGPGEVLSLAEAEGVIYAGTLGGELHVVDGGLVRRFADHKGRPVRHLAFADGALWVAAAGQLHRFDGCSWTASGPEPTALATDPTGRLWAIVEGRLHVGDGSGLRELPLPLERPWALAAVPGALWIGGRETVWRLATAPRR